MASEIREIYESLKTLNQFVKTIENDTILNVLNGCAVKHIKEKKQ